MRIDLSQEELAYVIVGLDNLLPAYRRPTTEQQYKSVMRLRERLKIAHENPLQQNPPDNDIQRVLR